MVLMCSLKAMQQVSDAQPVAPSEYVWARLSDTVLWLRQRLEKEPVSQVMKTRHQS